MLPYQDIFDKAYKHARTMVRKAKKDDACMYRVDSDPTCESERCLIGACIADEDYNPAMEGPGILGIIEHGQYFDILVKSQLIDNRTDLDRARFLNCLQTCHDGADNVTEMMQKLREFARTFFLVIPE